MSNTINIACIGDSVVYGRGVKKDRESHVWTAVMERNLNQKTDGSIVYEVHNFGLNGQGVLPGAWIKDGQIDSPLYEEMLNWEPDGVFLSCGGNDSHTDIWDETEFREEYRRLGRDIADRYGHDHVCIMSSTYAPTKEGARQMKLTYNLINDVVANEINAVIRETASELKTDYIDVMEMFRSYPEYKDNLSALFYDEIHPNEEGNDLIGHAGYVVASRWNFS